MADLDTRSKRASSVGLLRPYVNALVLPDGTLDQGDRQHAVGNYSGILASITVVYHHVLVRTGQVAVNKPDEATAYSFNGATVSLLAFSFVSRGMSTGDTLSYYADDAEGNWERGVGRWDATAKTITRTTIRDSSTGSAIDWSASTTYPTVWSDGYHPEDSIELGSSEAYYLGDRYTNGSWRIYRVGNDMEFQRRELDSWVAKGTVLA